MNQLLVLMFCSHSLLCTVVTILSTEELPYMGDMLGKELFYRECFYFYIN